jgi:hypothetical protein
MAINRYSKWCEAKVVVDHDAKIGARFSEDEIIYGFGVPKYVLTNNGSKWVAEFNKLWKNYKIIHQHTPQWLWCNSMVERTIKTLKDGLIVLFMTLKHT